MLKKSLTITIAFVLLSLAVAACSPSPTPTPVANAPTSSPNTSANASASNPTTAPTRAAATLDPQGDPDGDSIPTNAEAVLGTDPNNADTDGDGVNDLQDTIPTQADNPINETSTTQGFTIDSALVENNVDANGGDVPDHLELSVTNTTDVALTNFDVYYTITDSTANVTQSTYRTLPGFTLQPGETKALHFDNTGQPDHYSVNPNSLYATSANALDLQVTLHAEGYAPQTITVTKDAGGAEGGVE